MINKLTIVAYEKKTGELYAKLLKRLFHKYIDIENYNVEDGKINDITSDIILASAHSIYEYVKKYTTNYNDIIIADLTLKKKSVDKLKSLPSGTKAMLVNSTLEMAISTINIIYNYGIENIELFPVYPGMKEIPNYSVAITPGETEIVPCAVQDVIDLGDRILSMKTIADIAAKLNIPHILHTPDFQSYFDSIIMGDLGLNELFDQVNLLEKKLDLVLQIFDEGVISLNGSGIINFVNKTAEKMFGIEKAKAIGCSINEIIPELKNKCSEQAIKGVVMSIEQQFLIVSVYPVKYSDDVKGHLILAKKFTDAENEQYKIRKQIMSRGHVAKYNFDDIVGNSQSITNIKAMARKMALSNSSVYIYGQSGTGKELFAQSIHNSSNRREYPFIAINCASIPENLLESELFGYAEGAFTGAKKGGKTGYFELAHMGTLFLDEISEMNLNLQNRLLRVLQEKQVVRIGGDTVIDIDVRIISASNKNLKELVRQNKFRKDLYYRLNVLMLNIPPLCNRKEDIPIIIDAFKKEMEVDFQITDKAMEIIKNCKWEGNVRELQNFVERLIYVNKDVIDVDDVLNYLENDGISSENSMTEEEVFIFKSFINKYKMNLYKYYNVLKILNETYGTGIKLGRRTISEMLQKKGLYFSEQEIRTILNDLSIFEMVYVSRGRGGTSITAFGLRVYDTIANEYKVYIMG